MKKQPVQPTQLSFLPLTAKTKGAVAVIDVVGSELAERLSQAFEPVSKQRFCEFRPQSLIYGHWQNRLGSREDLLLCPISDHQVEIQCHGGPAAVDAICDTLCHLGFSLRESETLTGLSSDAVGIWETELTQALQRCPTTRTAKWVLNQLNHSPALITSLEEMTECERVQAVDDALAWSEFGRHLITPWRVVLAGRPNVGKSSLINALAGFERAIVHATPGTTRDVVQQATAIDGWPVVFSDTAGLRNAENPIEVEGIEAARKVILESDVLVHVVDGSRLDDLEPIDTRELGREPDLVVINKQDLLTATDRESVKVRLGSDRPAVLISATSREGLGDFTAWLSHRLVPQQPNSDALVPITERMVEWLKGVRESSSKSRQSE